MSATAAVSQPIFPQSPTAPLLNNQKYKKHQGLIFERLKQEEMEREWEAVSANESHLKIRSILNMYEFPGERLPG